MSNETDPLAHTVHGTNPQNLIEQIVRAKIYESRYWKEECFGLSAEALVDKGVVLNHVGGTYGGAEQPCPFLCLVEKMLQIQPDKEIILEFIKNEDHKYLRLLGAFYLRLTGKAVEVYQYLEPLYNDYRKVRQLEADGGYVLTHIDTVVDDMLRKDFLFDISLPRIPLRIQLERAKALEPRVSLLAEDFDESALEAEASKVAKELAELEEQRQIHERDLEKERSKNREKIRARRTSNVGKSEETQTTEEEESSRRSRSNSPEKPKEKKKKKKKVDADEATEIAEANALREKLGLKPLR